MSSTEIVRVGQSFESSNAKPFPSDISDMPGYFYGRQESDIRFSGFYTASANLISQMANMADHSRGGEVVTLPVPLNPAMSDFDPSNSAFLAKTKDTRPYKLYESDYPVGSQAFINLTYHLIGAEEIFDTRRGKEGYVLLQAQYEGSDIYFVEQYAHDVKKSPFMTWSVASGIPPEVYDAELVRKAETQKVYFEQAVLGGLKAVSVLDEEPDQVRRAA